MAYPIPRYVLSAGIDDRVLQFKWDDWNPVKDFLYDSEGIVERLAGVTFRAKIAAAIGMYEWIICRFRGLSDDPSPFQIAEAAWCANVHLDYMEYFELPRREWRGPVRCPLWGAATRLASTVFFGDDTTEGWKGAASYLPRLAVHVLPKPAVFEQWLDASVARLAVLYPAPEHDPFDDLFGENYEQRRGPLVAREALDPGFDYKPEDAPKLIANFLRTVDYRRNPYLLSPEQMVAEGFEGTPYTIA